MAQSKSSPGLHTASSQEAQDSACLTTAKVAGTAPASARASSALGPPLMATSASTCTADAARVLQDVVQC